MSSLFAKKSEIFFYMEINDLAEMGSGTTQKPTKLAKIGAPNQ